MPFQIEYTFFFQIEHLVLEEILTKMAQVELVCHQESRNVSQSDDVVGVDNNKEVETDMHIQEE